MKDGFDVLEVRQLEKERDKWQRDERICREQLRKTLEENKQLKQCNKCMRYQLDHKPFDCKCSLDDSCEWTRNVNNELQKKKKG
jgi:hypothetical protein